MLNSAKLFIKRVISIRWAERWYLIITYIKIIPQNLQFLLLLIQKGHFTSRAEHWETSKRYSANGDRFIEKLSRAEKLTATFWVEKENLQKVDIDARPLLPRPETAKAGHACQHHGRWEIRGSRPTAGAHFSSPDLESLYSLRLPCTCLSHRCFIRNCT